MWQIFHNAVLNIVSLLFTVLYLFFLYLLLFLNFGCPLLICIFWLVELSCNYSPISSYLSVSKSEQCCLILVMFAFINDSQKILFSKQFSFFYSESPRILSRSLCPCLSLSLRFPDFHDFAICRWLLPYMVPSIVIFSHEAWGCSGICAGSMRI